MHRRTPSTVRSLRKSSRDPIIAGLVARVGYIKHPPVYNALALARETRNVGLPDEVAEKSALPA